MSTAQLKALADKLSARESKWLTSYLSAKARASDPAWKAEMARRLKRMRAGQGMTETEYRRRYPESPKRAAAAAK